MLVLVTEPQVSALPLHIDYCSHSLTTNRKLVTNRMNRDGFRQDLRDVNYASRKIGLSLTTWILIALAVFGAIGIGIWYFGVATSSVKGAGDATKTINSSANRLQAQAKYSQLYNGILAADVNIDTFADTYRTSKSERNLTNFTGAQAICRASVGEYNAMATNPVTKPWIPIELPVVVGGDPATDCKPSTPIVAPSS